MPKPQLDHFIGHTVQSVVKPLFGKDWHWGIILDNGVEIRNYEDSPPPLENLVMGLSIGLCRWVPSVQAFELGLYRLMPGKNPKAERSLYFGNFSITIGDDEFFPMVYEEGELPIPEDPSPERVVE